jgi:hypothetical protein
MSSHAEIAMAETLPVAAAGPTTARRSPFSRTVEPLRMTSVRGLSRMYDPRERLFVFRLRRTPAGIVQEGLSLRYTAITLMGLGSLPDSMVSAVLGSDGREDVCRRALDEAARSDNLGDVALTLLAADAVGYGDVGSVARRLAALNPADAPHPVVEIAWALAALSDVPSADVARLRDRLANRLMSLFNPKSRLFPHAGASASLRSHVSCFADLIYPIHALAKYSSAAGSARALDISATCATHLCSLQGEAGQWWWHYDYRTGAVLERYPVYAIHQDAMGPMGLLALRAAGGPDCSRAIGLGLQWLLSAPELAGGSLIDDRADLIWRKVARREPRKIVRYLQSAVSRVHPSFRIPAVDALFPPGAIDYEDRPYHLGWLLYAWRDEVA